MSQLIENIKKIVRNKNKNKQIDWDPETVQYARGNDASGKKYRKEHIEPAERINEREKLEAFSKEEITPVYMKEKLGITKDLVEIVKNIINV